MLASLALVLLIGVVVGVTTVLFGFGGGFVTVPVIAFLDAGLGAHAIPVATATSALVMLVNGVVATAATDRAVLARLRGRWLLLALLAVGGAVGAAAGRFSPEWLLRWGFVAYVALTIGDLVLRPGFVRVAASPRSGTGRTGARRSERSGGVPDSLGLGIGAVAAFLGVGGSVMTVPLMRRAGSSMSVAAMLANPLTVAVVAPAFAVSLALSPGAGSPPSAPGLIGSVDVASALALLAGAIPVIVVLRRRPPRIPDAIHAWIYLALLAASACAVALAP